MKYRISKIQINGKDKFYIERKSLFFWVIVKKDLSSTNFGLGKDQSLRGHGKLYLFDTLENAEEMLKEYLGSKPKVVKEYII